LVLALEHDADASPQPARILSFTDATDPGQGPSRGPLAVTRTLGLAKALLFIPSNRDLMSEAAGLTIMVVAARRCDQFVSCSRVDDRAFR
jgi:hypothetical protein